MRGGHGAASTVARLAELGYLKKAGITAMPPHVCYVISEEGNLALEIADALH
jgi:hypothetical protein